MSCELDPNEVLLHLHELGYYNITPEQLKEFIRDLEKLIQHDITKRQKNTQQLKSPDNSASSPLPNTTDESTCSSPPLSDPGHHRSQHTVHYLSSNIVEQVSCSSSESSIAPSRRVLRECTKHLSQKNQGRENLFRNKSADASKAPSKPIKTCECPWRRIGCKCCEELMSQEQNSLKMKSKENLAPPRPKSSFIRTWQTQAGSYRSQRCDPVALYQQYQQVWKQQKLPGEDNHNDLRWSVRERLLGQQPLPRVEQSCCCECKCCPCKLSEKNFSKNPKKVSSRILPRGPFHIEGHIFGPISDKNDGEFVASDRRLRGVLEVCSDSSESKKTENPTWSQLSTPRVRERAVWLSKKDIEDKEENGKSGEKKQNQGKDLVFALTGEEMESRRKNHNRSTCKYCGLIHYMLSSSEGSDSFDKGRTNIKPTFKPDIHPTIDLTEKSCNEKDHVLNKNLGECEKKRPHDSQGSCMTQMQSKNKGATEKGYWHKQMTKPDAQKNTNESCSGRNVESYGHWRHRLASPNQGLTNKLDSTASTTPREQWPQQLTVQADIHGVGESSTLSPGSVSTRLTSTPAHSTPSPDRHYRPVLNLATATSPQQPGSKRQSDSYFETRTPLTLKGFQGEVQTEIEVHKRQREDSISPFLTVATKVKIHKV